MNTTILVYSEPKDKSYITRAYYIGEYDLAKAIQEHTEYYSKIGHDTLGYYEVKKGDTFQDYSFGIDGYTSTYLGTDERNQGFGGWIAPTFKRVSKYSTDIITTAGFHDTIRQGKDLRTEFNKIATKL